MAVRRVGVLLLVRFAKPNLCVWGGHILDETPVGTVILSQIGELPVHLSVGEVLL